MKRPLPIEVSDLATAQIRAAEEWWRANRPAAPHAIREELERASWLIAVQPGVGAVARNVSLAGVRRLHLARIRYHLYYQVITDPDRVEVLAFWQRRETRDVVRVQPALVGHTDVLINTADAMGGQGMQRLAVTRGADGWTG